MWQARCRYAAQSKPMSLHQASLGPEAQSCGDHIPNSGDRVASGVQVLDLSRHRDLLKAELSELGITRASNAQLAVQVSLQHLVCIVLTSAYSATRMQHSNNQLVAACF